MAWANDQIRDLVIRTLIGESDGSPEGMSSIAHVMKNRALSGAWGPPNGGLTRVITAPKQFSIWNPGYPHAAALRAIPTTDPRYQRAGAIADGVFSDQIPDPTGGATHYHTPSVSPDWSQGVRPVATIGGHYFYKLPLTASNTAGTAVISPSTVGMGGSAAPSAPASGSADGFVYGGESPQDQGVDTRHLEPVFAARIAKLQADAAAAGIKTHLTDGYRDNTSQAADYAKLGKLGLAAAPGSSYHQFGRAVDLAADNPAQQQALIALADQPGRGITAGAHFQTPDLVHFQAAEGKTAPLLEAGTSAPAKPIGQGGIGSDASAPLGTASPGPPAVSTIVPNPNVPAANAQPVSATAPAAPGSEKYPVIARMTTGTGSRNPELITAANWGNLSGGSTPVTPPASTSAAPAPAQPTPDLAQRVPLDRTPTPPPRPADAAASTPPAPTSPLASIIPHWGSSTPVDPDTIPASAPPYMPGSGLNGAPAMSGGPSMGFPAMTNPFAALPGSMFASAQNLIKLLYPTG